MLSFGSFAQRGFHDNERSDYSITPTADYVVKFSPTQLMAGQFTFSFEQNIHNKGSLELSVGATAGSIGFAPWVAMGPTYLNTSFNYNSNLGYSLSLGYRYYAWNPGGAQLHGFYLSPVLKFNVLRAEGSKQNQQPLTDSKLGFDAHLTTFTIQAGYQFIIGKEFTLDMYIGSGLGNRKVENTYTDFFYDENTTSYLPYESTSVKNSIFTSFVTGLKLGFGGKYNRTK